MGNLEDGSVETRRNAKPLLAVVRGDRAVAWPAIDVCAAAGVPEADPARLTARALQAEVEPLPEIGVRIGANVDADVVGAIESDRLDCAGVEGVADFEHSVLGIARRLAAPHIGAAMLPSRPLERTPQRASRGD